MDCHSSLNPIKPKLMKPTIDTQVLFMKLQSRLGDISCLQPIAEGEESRAFRLTHGGHSLVVRINRSPAGFLKDDFAYRHFSRASLPVPEVLFIGPYDEHHAYCVSAMIEGETLQALATTKLPAVLDSVEVVMAEIAASDVSAVEGFGPFDEQGVGSHSSWREFVLAPCAGYQWGLVGDCLDFDAVETVLKALSRVAPDCPDVRQLVHGDFGSNNVLTDGRDITGVIDWSEAMVGDALFDVANVLFWRTWLPCMEAQAQHFGQRGLVAANEDVLRCYQIRIGLHEAYSNALSGDATMARWALDRCGMLI